MTEFQPKNFTILFVHNEPTIQEIMEYSLKEKGYQVQLADGGDSALSMIATSPPDLIITEVDLEGMSGVELTRQVREHHQLPVIFLFSTCRQHRSTQEKLQLTKEVGANTFAERPIDLKRLLKKISTLLKQNQP